MNEFQFKTMAGTGDETARRWYSPLSEAMKEFGITFKHDVAMFIAQTGHESGGFQHVIESLNYTVEALLDIYGSHITRQQAEFFGRSPLHSANQEVIANIVYGKRLGNQSPGDGWKYRGRGLIQITGADNYLLCGDALKLNLTKSPELLEEDAHAARSAAWFYVAKGCLRYGEDIVRVTRMINGGTNGLEDRRDRFDKALRGVSGALQ
jgi:putative chitinase